MSMVCIALTLLLGGWEREIVGFDMDTAGFRGVIIGNGRNDGTLRVYGGSDDRNLYEFSYSNGIWERMLIKKQGLAQGISIGPGRGDGINRVYAATDTLLGFPEVYEYTWNGTGWDARSINTQVNATYDAQLGFGRNDGVLHIYSGTLGGECFEYTWSGSTWSSLEIGGSAKNPLDDVQQTVCIGAGRNDDTLRVYSTCTDGKVWEFTFRNDQWFAEIIDTVDDYGADTGSSAWVPIVAEGRNDGVKRLYVASGIPQITPGRVHEYTWNESQGQWVDVMVGEVDEAIWGLCAGEARNDGLLRIYTGTRKGYLHEYTWQQNQWRHVECGDLGNWEYIHDISIARGRNDDTLRIYAGGGDGYIHEFTWRPETGVSVYPDSSIFTDAGVPVRYNLWVKNTGKQADTIDLATRGTLSGWTTELLDAYGNPLGDSDTDGKPDVGHLEKGDSAAIRIRITPSATATGGTRDSTIVTGTTTLLPAAQDEASLVTVIAQAAGVVVEPDQTSIIEDGGQVDYTLTVRNTSTNEDLVDLYLQGPLPDWTAEFLNAQGTVSLTDSDADGMVDVGPLSAYGGSIDIILRLAAPVGEYEGTVDTTFVVGQSDLDENVRDSARLLSTVFNPVMNVTVEPDTSGVTGEREIAYNMRVINSASEPDSFSLWTTSDLGWQAEIHDPQGDVISSTGPLDPSETLFVNLVITVPEGMGSISGPPGQANTERRLLWARSITDSEALDSAVIVTMAAPPLDIHNYPNPFRGSTTFIYSIPGEGKATLAVYNRAGEHIITLFEDKEHSSGIYTVPWEGVNAKGAYVAPGVYLYSLVFRPKEGGVEKLVKKALLQP